MVCARVDGMGATVLVPLLEKFGFNLPAIKLSMPLWQISKIVCAQTQTQPTVPTHPRFLWISPSPANFLAIYVINLISILYGVFTDVLLQSSDPVRELSNVLMCYDAHLKQLTPDDIDFATNPVEREMILASSGLIWFPLIFFQYDTSHGPILPIDR